MQNRPPSRSDDRPPSRSDDRPPSRADDRAQTVQDFAVGISLFLLTVGFVFAFVPSLFTPFQSDVAPGSTNQADRVGSSIVNDLSMDDRPNWITKRDAAGFFNTFSTAEDLQDRYGLPTTAQINVTIVPLNDTTPVDFVGITGIPDLPAAAGDTYRDVPAASVSRVVVVKGVPECDPALDPGQGQGCRLIVRIW